MVDNENFDKVFCGASLTVSTDGNILETPQLRVTIDPATLSVTVFDKSKNFVLTTFSYSALASGNLNTNTSPNTPVLRWTREQTQAVYGIAQSPGYDSAGRNSEGNWLGLKLNPPSDFGNVMTGAGGGAMSYTQFPIAYSLAPTGYNYAFFLDDQHTTFWDLTSATHSVSVKGARALRWFVIGGATLLDVRRQYMVLTGRPTVLPKSWLGYHQARFGYANWGEAMVDVNALNAANIPVDNVILDLYWFGEKLTGSGPNSKFGALAWDTVNFPDPAGNAKAIRAKGPGLTLIEEPYIAQNGPTFAFLRQNNALVLKADKTSPVILNSNPWWGIGKFSMPCFCTIIFSYTNIFHYRWLRRLVLSQRHFVVHLQALPSYRRLCRSS
jgi:alpha-glucosidase (family GH31 glycosyl hydrolase)